MVLFIFYWLRWSNGIESSHRAGTGVLTVSSLSAKEAIYFRWHVIWWDTKLKRTWMNTARLQSGALNEVHPLNLYPCLSVYLHLIFINFVWSACTFLCGTSSIWLNCLSLTSLWTLLFICIHFMLPTPQIVSDAEVCMTSHKSVSRTWVEFRLHIDLTPRLLIWLRRLHFLLILTRLILHMRVSAI